MKAIKKITEFLMVTVLVLHTVFLLPTVYADEIPLYDYSSFVGKWHDDRGVEFDIIRANENSITLRIEGEQYSITCPIVGNTATWNNSMRNYNITSSLTFYDDSICWKRSGVTSKESSEQFNIPEFFYQEYWFTSDTVRPHKIITGDYSIVLNGTKLEFDQRPVMCNDRILVPMRKIFEELGYNVEYYLKWMKAKKL